MLNSDQIFELIDAVAFTASKNEKIALLKVSATDSDFVRVLEYAYNPFKKFGIAKRPSLIGPNSVNEFDSGTWELLDDLAARRLTGNAAIEAVRGEMTALTAESAELFWRIIKKDLRAGFSESTCNKVVKGLIPTYPYMRCTLPKDAKLDQFDWKVGVLSQEKADGMFANVDHEINGLVRITSRQGTEFPIELFEDLALEVRDRLKPETQSHGEILVMKAGVICAREIGNGIMNGVANGRPFEADESPIFMIWDQIPLSAVVPKGKYEVPYVKRVASIMGQLKSTHGSAIALIETRVYHSLADAYDHYRELLNKGKEGTIIKDPRTIWEDRTSKTQVKLKLEVDIDLKVIAVVPGKESGKNEGRAGSLTCVTSCNGLKVDVTVKNDDMRDRIDADPEDWIDRILVVRSNAIMKPSASNPLHSLFLPRMVETDYRTDKTEPDSLVRVFDQFESSLKAA